MRDSPVPPVIAPPPARRPFRSLWHSIRPDYSNPETRRRALLYGLGPIVLLADIGRTSVPGNDPGWGRQIRIVLCAEVSLAGNVGLIVLLINAAADIWSGRQDRTLVVGLVLAVVAATVPLLVAARLTGPGPDPMPVFTLEGKDRLAGAAISAYSSACLGAGLGEQADQVALAQAEFEGWQQRHPDVMQYPDHLHVPVTTR